MGENTLTFVVSSKRTTDLGKGGFTVLVRVFPHRSELDFDLFFLTWCVSNTTETVKQKRAVVACLLNPSRGMSRVWAVVVGLWRSQRVDLNEDSVCYL